jgi:serine/threonine protein kinase
MSGSLPVIPGYVLISAIGRGAYGEVFLAEDATGRRVALKVVTPRPELTDKMLQRELGGLKRFLAVAESDPHLVRIHELIENLPCGGFAYAMELADSIHGHGVTDYTPLTLRHRLRTAGRLTVSESLQIAIGLCAALEHLHRQGLVHRDVKPANVIFVHGQPKLADLGLISGESDSTSSVGTQGYHAPEGTRGPKADLFSLGKVLYEMATGCDRQDFPELPPDFPTFADSRELLGLNPVFAKACAANPDRRYPNAGRFRRDLLLLQSGVSLYRQQWIRRGLVALLIVGGVGGLGMGWWRQEQESRFWRTSSPVERVNRAYRPEHADSWRRHFIPARPKGTNPRQIDLTRLYNGGLSQSLFLTLNPREAIENNWGTLPAGNVTLGGVPFDIRGVIQLNGRNTEARIAGLIPRSVHIPLDRPLQRLHILHAVQWGDPVGTVVAKYRLHYTDGSTAELPVEFERDVMAWWVGWNQPHGDLPRAKRVATGSNAALPGDPWSLALYLRSWDNPHPERPVARVEFESTMQNSAPFMAGLTVE